MPDHLSIRHVMISSLHLDPANARTHGNENLEAIVGSLKRFGLILAAVGLMRQERRRPRA